MITAPSRTIGKPMLAVAKSSEAMGLPALRSISRLAGVPPVLIVDSREQTPLVFTRLKSERGTLVTGDYAFKGGEELFSIERKTVSDFVACCIGTNRERFERELHRLRGYRFKRLLIVGTRAAIERKEYQSNITPRAVLGTLAAFEARYDVPASFCPTAEEAALQVEQWAFYVARECVETVNEMARALVLTSPSTDLPLPPTAKTSQR